MHLQMLAHAGPGASWQAMIVLAGVLLTGVMLAAAAGLLTVSRPDDLVVPLAGAAVVSSLAPIGGEILSDAVGWALPLFVVSLVTLCLAAFTPLDLRLPSPLPMGAVALAAVTSVLLYPPLTATLHPPAEILPLSEDSAVTITSPQQDAVVAPGAVEVTVAVAGGSIGPGDVAPSDLPDDPEEAGALAVAIAPAGDATAWQRVEVAYEQTCTVADPCGEVTFELDLEPGAYELTVEFTRGDGVPLAPFVRDRAGFTIADM